MTQLMAVRRKTTGHRQAETALAQVQQHPEDVDRVRELGRLLATRVYGHAQVGQVLTVGQACDIYIQPSMPAATPASATLATTT
jgi:hypothetical protein